jgi:arrestin-related trafficking adapter 9
MPVETLFSNPLPAIPPPKSIISRITSPWAKRNRNIADFSIEPEHQWKTYGPGDLVKGNVLLAVEKGFDIIHLVTCLHGYAKVYKHQVVLGESVVADGILDIRGGNQGVEYRGNGLVSLFQDEVRLCGDGFLKKGTYKFGFELNFPAKSLPSSIDVSLILLVVCSIG